jgi:hypothetical protein
MKHRLMVIAAAAMLALGVGVANAAENETVGSQSMSPELSRCGPDQNLCVNQMTQDNQLFKSDAEVGLRLGQPDELVPDDLVIEAEAEDAEETDAEEAGDQPEQLIIILQ